MLERSGVGESTLRTEKADLQLLLQRKTHRYDLTEQLRSLLITERPLIALDNPLQ